MPMPTPILIISSSEALQTATALRDRVNNLITAHGFCFHCETWDDFFKSSVRGRNQSFWDLLYIKSQELKRNHGYVVALWTFDDQAIIREKYCKVTRGNVILEYGLFYGALGPDYMFYFTETNKHPYTPTYIPTDLAGIRYDVIKDTIDINDAADTILSRLLKDPRTKSSETDTKREAQSSEEKNPLIGNILNYNV